MKEWMKSAAKVVAPMLARAAVSFLETLAQEAATLVLNRKAAKVND